MFRHSKRISTHRAEVGFNLSNRESEIISDILLIDSHPLPLRLGFLNVPKSIFSMSSLLIFIKNFLTPKLIVLDSDGFVLYLAWSNDIIKIK